MSDKQHWKVNEGTQIAIGDKMYFGGEEFTATDAELDEFGSRTYVTEARQQGKAENKAVAAPEPQSVKKTDK